MSLTDGATTETCQLIVAPDRCYSPATAERDAQYFGVSCQLYCLRSEQNWGIGDFSDLYQLVEKCAPLGIDVIGLNPMHAPLAQGSTETFSSPYSPSDRRFLNWLYLDLEAETDYTSSDAAQTLRAQSYIKIQLEELRAETQVNYVKVAELKRRFLRLMYAQFCEAELEIASDRATEFYTFVAQRGIALEQFSLFEAGRAQTDQSPDNDPRFHQYIQWLADIQLGRCQRRAQSLAMAIGIKGDLAVGASQAGAEVSCNPNLYTPHCTIGAPPDPFSETGQNWALPAVDPIALRKNGYRHFIDLLQANMRHVGALRIDHVMALLRLWWCSADTEGTYVYYPMDELFALLCLESQRNRCMVIGEDMGVVPPELRHKLSEVAALGNRLLYFETDYEGRFFPPHAHRTDVLLSITNHDVPTLAGWWNGQDIQLRRRIGMINSDDASDLAHQARNRETQQLWQWLADAGELWEGAELINNASMNWPLLSAIVRCSCQSAAAIVLVQLDDLLLIESPINIPGTYLEYSNWQRKHTANYETLLDTESVQALLTNCSASRHHS